MTRETLYVGSTRGRDANHTYVVTDAGMCEEHQRQAASTGRDVLVSILANPGVEPSATEVMRHELNAASSPARRAAIQEHIAQADALGRWQSGLVDAGLRAELVPARWWLPLPGPRSSPTCDAPRALASTPVTFSAVPCTGHPSSIPRTSPRFSTNGSTRSLCERLHGLRRSIVSRPSTSGGPLEHRSPPDGPGDLLGVR
jgi:hypothetical protein